MSGNVGRLFFAALLVCALVLAIFWQNSRPALACSCIAPKQVDKALKESIAVFSGQVTDIKTDKLTKTVSFDVYRAWKGIPQDKDSVITTAADDDLCGYPFEESKEYLVYAYAGVSGDLNASLCSRTAPIKQAGADLAVLGSGYGPSQPTTQDQLEKCVELGIRPEKCSETAIIQSRSRDLPETPEEREQRKRTLDLIMTLGIGLAAAGVAAGLLVAKKRK